MTSIEQTVSNIRKEAEDAHNNIEYAASEAIKALTNGAQDLRSTSVKRMKVARKHIEDNPVAYSVSAGIFLVAIASLFTFLFTRKSGKSRK